MRKLFELQSPDLYNEASTSEKSMDQEMESSEMSNDGNVAKRNSTFRCFFFKIDLNCTRMVRNYSTLSHILMNLPPRGKSASLYVGHKGVLSFNNEKDIFQ